MKFSHECKVATLLTALAALIYCVCVFSIHTSIQESENDRRVIQVKKNSPSVIFFYKDTCSDCKKVYKSVWFENVKHKDIQMVNLNQPMNKHYIGEYDLKYVPTFVFVKNGKEQKRYVGTNKGNIQKIFKEVSGNG